MKSKGRSPNFDALVVPKEEAEAIRTAAAERAAAANAPSDPNAGAFEDANSRAGYNSFWTNPGQALAVVRGVIPFIVADILRILLIAAVPALSLWLPNLLFKAAT